MGITGLLPYLKQSGRPISVRELAGQTVAVDTYCWLHKGAFACAEKLGVGQETDQYVHYCMRYLRLLLSNRIKVVLVFDGKNLPAKADVEHKRRETRAAYKRKALQLLAEGRSTEAREAFERCIDVTPSMALALMTAARREGADTIVAPYEADAQLTHLCNAGLVDAVISEDSDLLAFGCRRVIFKLDSQGNGLLMERCQIARQLCIPAAAAAADADENAPKSTNNNNSNSIDDSNGGASAASGMTWAKFRWMCILSGCDYFSGVPGVGLATAAGIVKRTCLDLRGLANKLFLYAKKVQRLSKDQVEAVVRADLTFQYQVVFDPISRRQCRLNSPASPTAGDLDFAGTVLSDNELALQLAHGNIDFHTMQPVANFDPDAHNDKGDQGKTKNTCGKPSTTNSSNSSTIWASGGPPKQRRVASEAVLGSGFGASPYFTGASGSASKSSISSALWRSDSAGDSFKTVGNTERLCKLYSTLSSDSLLATEVATVAEAIGTDEKENSDSSARLEDPLAADQGDAVELVESAAAAVGGQPPAESAALISSSSQQELRQPEFRLFGEPAAQSQPLLPARKLSTTTNSEQSTKRRQSRPPDPRQSVLSRYFQPSSASNSASASPSSGLRRQLFPVSAAHQSPSSTSETDEEPSKKKSRLSIGANAPFKSPTISTVTKTARSSLMDRFGASRPARVGCEGDQPDDDGEC